jgi:monoamine oxidase
VTRVVSRRAFARSLFAGALAPALARCGGRPEQAEVLVIGAGIAGLYAAWLLQQRGISPLVIEASDRVGGRMAPAPAGGMSIGAGSSRALAMLEKMGVAVLPRSVRAGPIALAVNGTLLDSAGWPGSAANRLVGAERGVLPHDLAAYYLDAASPLRDAGDWLQPAFAGIDARSLGAELARLGASGEALRLTDILHDGKGIGGVSALFAYQQRLLEKAAGAAPLGIDGGGPRLPEAIAARLDRPVRLRQAVARIKVDESGVECRCAGGQRYRARLALCSVPWSVLRDMVLVPQPPQAAMIRGLAYDRVTEVTLAFRRPFWLDDGLPPEMISDRPFERVLALRAADGVVTGLCCRIGGQQAAKLDDWNTDRIGRFVVREITSARPSAAGQLEVQQVTAWGQNPYVLGANHFWGPGQLSRAGDMLRRPWGTVHWIGEHMAVMQQGIEGAMESAEREVAEILRRLG